MGEEILSLAIPPTLCTNDVELEARSVVAGQAIGQLVGTTAAPLVRAGKLLPLLTRLTSMKPPSGSRAFAAHRNPQN